MVSAYCIIYHLIFHMFSFFPIVLFIGKRIITTYNENGKEYFNSFTETFRFLWLQNIVYLFDSETKYPKTSWVNIILKSWKFWIINNGKYIITFVDYLVSIHLVSPYESFFSFWGGSGWILQELHKNKL